jgi:hypothetical protein
MIFHTVQLFGGIMGTRIFQSAIRIALVVLAVSVMPSAFAQFNASLSGTVTDSTGAVIPNATVTLRNTETQLLRTTTSSGAGTYQFSELPPGDYALNGTANGFQETSLDHVTLVAETPRNIDLKLQIGASDQTVTVSANEVPVLNTSDASTGNSLSSEDVTRLPAFGRDPYELLRLTPASSPMRHAAAPAPAFSCPTLKAPANPTLASSRRRTRSTPQALANASPPTPSSSMESAWTASRTVALPSSRPTRSQ